MIEAAGPNDTESASGDEAPTPAAPPKRSPGHRGQDVRDTVAELAARAHEISLEAGSKMSGALRDVIGAAAGLTAFAIESARDLVQYMVRRGQMTQEEADKLIREVEEASSKRGKAPKSAPEPKAKAATKTAPAKKPAAKKAATPSKKPAAKK
jgi:polyhydroxyalkanoate synthesis regulator phasin